MDWRWIGIQGGIMNKKKLEYFKKKLLKSKEEILNTGLLQSSAEFHVASEDLSDEADLANNVVNQQVSLSIRERELNKLRLIDNALNRIANSEFGECEDCGDDIGDKRLELQPWAELCIVHAEERERQYSPFARHA